MVVSDGIYCFIDFYSGENALILKRKQAVVFEISSVKHHVIMKLTVRFYDDFAFVFRWADLQLSHHLLSDQDSRIFVESLSGDVIFRCVLIPAKNLFHSVMDGVSHYLCRSHYLLSVVGDSTTDKADTGTLKRNRVILRSF